MGCPVFGQPVSGIYTREITMSKGKITALVLGLVLLLLGAIGAMIWRSIQIYSDTHTWATVAVAGEHHGDTDDAYSDQREYLKGEQLSVGTLTLVITDITHDGTVTFRVKYGELTDQSGASVEEDTLTLNQVKYYSTSEDSFSLRVTSNRYQ